MIFKKTVGRFTTTGLIATSAGDLVMATWKITGEKCTIMGSLASGENDWCISWKDNGWNLYIDLPKTWSFLY